MHADFQLLCPAGVFHTREYLRLKPFPFIMLAHLFECLVFIKRQAVKILAEF
jgi:hypothetical protein